MKRTESIHITRIYVQRQTEKLAFITNQKKTDNWRMGMMTF